MEKKEQEYYQQVAFFACRNTDGTMTLHVPLYVKISELSKDGVTLTYEEMIDRISKIMMNRYEKEVEKYIVSPDFERHENKVDVPADYMKRLEAILFTKKQNKIPQMRNYFQEVAFIGLRDSKGFMLINVPLYIISKVNKRGLPDSQEKLMHDISEIMIRRYEKEINIFFANLQRQKKIEANEVSLLSEDKK